MSYIPTLIQVELCSHIIRIFNRVLNSAEDITVSEKVKLGGDITTEFAQQVLDIVWERNSEVPFAVQVEEIAHEYFYDPCFRIAFHLTLNLFTKGELFPED